MILQPFIIFKCHHHSQFGEALTAEILPAADWLLHLRPIYFSTAMDKIELWFYTQDDINKVPVLPPLASKSFMILSNKLLWLLFRFSYSSFVFYLNLCTNITDKACYPVPFHSAPLLCNI